MIKIALNLRVQKTNLKSQIWEVIKPRVNNPTHNTEVKTRK